MFFLVISPILCYLLLKFVYVAMSVTSFLCGASPSKKKPGCAPVSWSEEDFGWTTGWFLSTTIHVYASKDNTHDELTEHLVLSQLTT